MDLGSRLVDIGEGRVAENRTEEKIEQCLPWDQKKKSSKPEISLFRRASVTTMELYVPFVLQTFVLFVVPILTAMKVHCYCNAQ